MIDLDRELRALLEDDACSAPPPPGLEPIVRRTHRRQCATVAVGLVAVMALAAASIAGATALLRSSERPAEPPDMLQLGPLEAIPFRKGVDGPGNAVALYAPITARSSDELWVGANRPGGIWRLANGTWTHFGKQDGRLVGGFWDAFAFTADGAVWASGYQGVVRFDGSTWERVASDEHRAIALGSGGTPWTARVGGEGWVVGPVGGPPIAEPVPLPQGSTLDSLLVVSEDDVWASSRGVWAGGGLAHFDGSGWVEMEPIAGARGMSVQDLARTEDGSLWADVWFRMEASEWSHALARFDGETWTTSREIDGVPLETGSHPAMYGALELAPNGDLLLGTNEGLFRYRDGAWNQVASGGFTSISVAPDGTVWLRGDGGLFRLPAS
jgi:hypothetical protein